MLRQALLAMKAYMAVFLPSLCGCLLQAPVAVACKPLWLFLASLCGCFLQALCGCVLQAFVAVSCKPLWLFVPRSIPILILFFVFAFEKGWRLVFENCIRVNTISPSLQQKMPCPAPTFPTLLKVLSSH